MSAAQPARRGLIDRVASAYGDVAGSTHALIGERPSEATLLSILFIVAIIGFFGATIELFARADTAAPDFAERFQTEIAEQFIGAMLVWPLGVYIISGIAAPLLRAVGGTGGSYETRVAFVWALAVAAPLLFVIDVLTAASMSAEGGVATAYRVAASALAGASLLIWARAVSAAHGFRRPWGVLAAALVLAMTIALALWRLGAS